MLDTNQEFSTKSVYVTLIHVICVVLFYTLFNVFLNNFSNNGNIELKNYNVVFNIVYEWIFLLSHILPGLICYKWLYSEENRRFLLQHRRILVKEFGLVILFQILISVFAGIIYSLNQQNDPISPTMEYVYYSLVGNLYDLTTLSKIFLPISLLTYFGTWTTTTFSLYAIVFGLHLSHMARSYHNPPRPSVLHLVGIMVLFLLSAIILSSVSQILFVWFYQPGSTDPIQTFARINLYFTNFQLIMNIVLFWYVIPAVLGPINYLRLTEHFKSQLFLTGLFFILYTSSTLLTFFQISQNSPLIRLFPLFLIQIMIYAAIMSFVMTSLILIFGVVKFRFLASTNSDNNNQLYTNRSNI